MKKNIVVDPVSVRIKMAYLEIKSKDIQKHFKCSPSAVSMAISGERQTFLKEINQWLTKLSNQRKRRERK